MTTRRAAPTSEEAALRKISGVNEVEVLEETLV